MQNARLVAALLAGACVLGAARKGSAATFVKGPYIQSLGQRGVTVKVELSAPEPISVELSPDGGATKTVQAASRRFHAVRVDGLEPATAYGYRVVAGATASAQGKFVTAPADARPFRFVAYGDSRSDRDAHAAVVRALAGAPADFLVHTGDMVHRGSAEDEWLEFFQVENALLRDKCLFGAIGNHELAGDRTGEAFLRHFAPADPDGREVGELHGTFRWSNTRFFLCNAMDGWDGAEREWLRAELAAARDEPGLVHRIAVIHHGPFSSGPHGGNRKLTKGDALSILRDGGVDLLISGHDHVYERGLGQGLKYVISGGAGAPLYPQERRAAETLAFESVFHFLEFAVDGESVRMVVRRAGGSILEQCGFRGDGGWECDAPSASPPADRSAAPTKASACGCTLPGQAPGPPRWAALLVLAPLVRRAKGRLGRSGRPEKRGDGPMDNRPAGR